MEIYTSNSVSAFMKLQFQSRPGGGHGELRKIAKACEIHTTTISQIFNGQREPSLEQGIAIAEYLALDDLETRYFLCLIQKARAGSQKLKNFWEAQLKELRDRQQDLSQVLRKDADLSNEEKAFFYSDWYYIGIAVLTSVPSLQDAEALSRHIGLPKKKTKEVLDYLTRIGVCKLVDGRYEPGISSTHLEAGSPLISRHHSNWRIRAMEKHPHLGGDEMAYSGPMSLSARDAEKVRKVLVNAIREISEIGAPSACEEAYCLNIDWFRI